MKKSSIVFVAVCVVALMVQFVSAQEKCSLKVIVKHVANDTGVVKIALFNSEESYSKSGFDPFMKHSVEIKNGQAEYVFVGIPRGEYAIKAIHDENKNGIHDKNFLGIPKEDYAFSNNATGTFGPAKYAKAKFIIDKAEYVMEINMTNAN